MVCLWTREETGYNFLNLDNRMEVFCMNEFLGPRDRNNELTANEELEILEAYQSADEYLNMDNDVDDFYFESEE